MNVWPKIFDDVMVGIPVSFQMVKRASSWWRVCMVPLVWAGCQGHSNQLATPTAPPTTTHLIIAYVHTHRISKVSVFLFLLLIYSLQVLHGCTLVIFDFDSLPGEFGLRGLLSSNKWFFLKKKIIWLCLDYGNRI